MFIAFLLIGAAVLVLITIGMPFLMRDGSRTDTSILPEYRRSYYVLITIGVEAIFAWLGIWGVLFLAPPLGPFSLSPAVRFGLIIADVALLGAGTLSMVVSIIVVLRNMQRHRPA